MPYSVDERAPKDYWLHFPAGDKASSPGSALRSQAYAAGPRGWTPYNPYNPSFNWRAGVCGDSLHGPQHHLRGGQFYHGARITASYTEGSVLGVGMSIVTHHNGYVEMHVCDVAKCGGEISRQCFLKGACVQLKRAYHPECQSGKSPHCGPIDRRYPGRWYLPCRSGARWDDYRPYYATFRLPKHFNCKHCVLQWYWVTGNTCNPPGVLDYFDGQDRPNWGTCPGQGSARGGVSRNKPPCGGYHFPEEYIQCADIKIDSVARARSAQLGDGGPSPSPTPAAHRYIKKLVLWTDGSATRELVSGSEINIGMYTRIGVQAIPMEGSGVSFIEFYMNNKKVNVVYAAPFFLRGKNYGMWLYNVPMGRFVRFAAKANGEWVTVDVKFFK
ncbi:unnamed protein product [Agarophyton chilense]